MAAEAITAATEQANELTSCQRREDETVMNEGKALFLLTSKPHVARIARFFGAPMYLTPFGEATASFPLAEYSENDLNSALGRRFSCLRKASARI